MRQSLVIITVLLASSQACEDHKSHVVRSADTTRIVGGSAVPIFRRPYVVQVHRDGQLVCGGSLMMSSRHVLTAAQCFYNNDTLVDNPTAYNVKVGHAEINMGTNYDVSKIIIHPEFNRASLHADIALVLLSTNVTLSLLVQPIEFDEGLTEIDLSVNVVIAGWGEPNPPDVLQQATMSQVDPQTCVLKWMTYDPTLNVTHDVLCLESPNPFVSTGPCAGDAGTPALIDVAGATEEEGPSPLLVGVVSRPTCASPLLPTVATRTRTYAVWVHDMIELHNSGPTSSAGAVLFLTSLLAFIVMNELQQIS